METTHDRTVRTPALLEEGQPFRQWRSWRIPGADCTLIGYSRANDKTFFHIPELKCCIDAGQCAGRRPDTVFLTHTHDDHVADLEFLAGKPTGVDLYVPAAAVPYAERYIRARRELNHVAPFNPELAAAFRLHPVSAGDQLSHGKRDAYRVRVFDCVHKVPCVGYAFDRRTTRLRGELAQLKDELVAAGRAREFGARLAELRRRDEPVEEERFEPLFAFVGDTHARVFAREPWLLEYPVIITECTFLDDAEKARAERVGHTLWSELEPVVTANPNTTFVLIHFSLRHSDAEVIEHFERATRAAPAGALENLVIWASRDAALPQQHQRR